MDEEFRGFYKLSLDERLNKVGRICNLADDEKKLLLSGGLNVSEGDAMRENVIGLYSLPFSVATNFLINGKKYLIPMVGEEPSVVAGASKAAKMSLKFGGFQASADESNMIGEIQVISPEDPTQIDIHKERLLKGIDDIIPKMKARGGGARDIWYKNINSKLKNYTIVYFSVDVRDAMGANTVNKVAEGISEMITDYIGGYTNVRILSNLAIYRLARAKATFLDADYERILLAQDLAENDIFRASTHNKGIMNGISALALATGNDTRAAEAAAHSYAAFNSRYGPLTKYYVENDKLIGEIELPIAMGIIGSGTNHKIARIALNKILKVKSSKELAAIAASLGLAQNFAALYAITREGINKGHMRLHSKTLALMLGATPEEAARVYEHFKDKEKEISMDSVKKYLEVIRNG